MALVRRQRDHDDGGGVGEGHEGDGREPAAQGEVARPVRRYFRLPVGVDRPADGEAGVVLEEEDGPDEQQAAATTDPVISKKTPTLLTALTALMLMMLMSAATDASARPASARPANPRPRPCFLITT